MISLKFACHLQRYEIKIIHQKFGGLFSFYSNILLFRSLFRGFDLFFSLLVGIRLPIHDDDLC